MRRFLRTNGLWLAAYFALLAATVAVLVQVRANRLEAWSDRDTQARWHEFQLTQQERRSRLVAAEPAGSAQAGSAQVGSGPGRATSSDPADVVLLRDHFGAVLGGISATGTFLFAFVAVLLRGSLRTQQAHDAPKGHTATERLPDAERALRN